MFWLTDVEALGSKNLGGVQQLAEEGKVANSATLHRLDANPPAR